MLLVPVFEMFRQQILTILLPRGSEQTDPLNALPTSSSCWMGFQLTLATYPNQFTAVYL